MNVFRTLFNGIPLSLVQETAWYFMPRPQSPLFGKQDENWPTGIFEVSLSLSWKYCGNDSKPFLFQVLQSGLAERDLNF